MHGVFNRRVTKGPQGASDKFSDETPKQQALHHEIKLEGKRKRRKRGRSAKNYVRLREIERIFRDRYGATLPDDDAGRDDLFVIANHLAHFDAPDKRITAWVRQWAPWHNADETTALIGAVIASPLKWRADPMAKRVGLNLSTRTRLRITTIGAIDCGKAKRAKQRKKRDAAQHRARRAKAGAAPHALSAERQKPWLGLGISRATYFRKRRNESPETDSSAAYAEHIVVMPKQSHGCSSGQPRLTRGAVDGVLPPFSEPGHIGPRTGRESVQNTSNPLRCSASE